MALELVQKSDKRGYPRFGSPSDLASDLYLLIGGRKIPGTLRDFSYSGMRIAAADLDDTSFCHEGAEVDIALDGERTFPGVIAHVVENADANEWILGVHLREAMEDHRFEFSSEDPDWDLITDAETVNTILNDLEMKGPEVLIDFRQISGRALLIPEKRDDEAGTFLCEVWDLQHGRLTPGKASCQFDMFQTCHAFETEILEIQDNKVLLKLPQQFARLLRRETVRVKTSDRNIKMKAELSSSLLGEASVPLYDITEHGVSFLATDEWACAPINAPVEEIIVTGFDGRKVIGKGAVRKIRWIAEEEKYLVGLFFDTETSDDQTKWHNLILAARYPTLAFEYRDNDHSGIWGLFERSGYLDLKPREAFTHVVDITKSTWKKLSDAGTQFSKRAIIRHEKGIVGHVQLDRIYPRTWCIHHLAIDPEISKVVGKELLAVTSDVVIAEGAHYVWTLTESTKPWNQRNYYDFIERYRYPEHNLVDKFQFYEADLNQDISLQHADGIEITTPNKWDLKRIIRYFEIYCSEMERDASALNDSDVLLEQMNDECSRWGLSRKRNFLVAKKGNQLLGFARMESGTLGVNIFGLLDLMYVYLIPGNSVDRNSIHETLVKAGLEYYRGLGKTDVLLLLDDGRSKFYRERGLTFVSEAIRWITLPVVAKRYFAFSQMLYGHLLLKRNHRRQNRRKKIE